MNTASTTKLIITATMHNYYLEKIFFGSLTLAAAFISWLGLLFSEGDFRWLFATLVGGIVTSTSMALLTRYKESMKIVVGRFLFALIGAVVGTRVLVFFFPKLKAVHDDAFLLAGFAAVMSVFFFTWGYGMIRSMDDEKLPIGKWFKDLLILFLTKK